MFVAICSAAVSSTPRSMNQCVVIELLVWLLNYCVVIELTKKNCHIGFHAPKDVAMLKLSRFVQQSSWLFT